MADVSSIEPWDQFSHDPRVAANADLRAADHDRAVIQTLLDDAFAEGRLTHDEHDERTEAALHTRTLGDLLPLVADLPAGRVPPAGVAVPMPETEKQTRALEAYQEEKKQAWWTFFSASLVCWVIWLVGNLGGDLTEAFPWPVFVMLGTGLNVGRVIFHKQETITSEVRRLERKERKKLERKKPNSDAPDQP